MFLRSSASAPNLASLLLSYIEGPKSLKPVLKLLYSLLCSSFSYEICQGTSGNSAARNGFKLELEEMVSLSAILFIELQKRLPSSLDDASVDHDVGLTEIHVEKDLGEEVLLLLRCYVLIVRLNPYNQILNERIQVVVSLLHKLSFEGILSEKKKGSIRFSDSISSQSTYGSSTNPFSPDACAKSSALYLRFLQQMLEVYLDEVYADRPIRERIAYLDSVFSTHQNQSSRSSIQIGSVLEVISAHFLLSISGKDVQTFTQSLIWTEKPFFSSPEVSLCVASSLINHPVVKSAPILLLTHLISLVSEVIGICVFPEVGPNVRCVNVYLSTFHDSVILYYEHLSELMTGSWSAGRIVRRPFESYFHSEIYERVNSVLLDLDNAWRAQSSCISSMEYDAISYIKMNIYVVNESCRDGIFIFLSSLIRRLFSVDTNEVRLRSFEGMAMQDICLLASILKLMSCSLLQATHCSENNLSCLIELLKRKDGRSGYSSLAVLLSCFAQDNLRMPIDAQQFMVDALKPHLSTYEEFELMILHFAGLLSSCIVSGLDILVRACLFFMLVLMNALSLELGSLEFLRPLVALRTESTPFALSQSAFTSSVACSSSTGSFYVSQKFCAKQTSSFRIASNFRKERRKLLRVHATSGVSGMSDEAACNGEKYLRCFMKTQKTIDELADFIECNPWRDYNARVLLVAKRQHLKWKESNRRLRLAKVQVNSRRRGSKK